MTPEDDMETSEQQEPQGLNLGALLPGGVSPGPQELAVAAIIIGALVFVIAVRKGFRPVVSR